MSELVVFEHEPDPILEMLFHNNDGTDTGYAIAGSEREFTNSTGWDFGAGNPESWKYASRLLVPEGNVLDIGMESGRSSFYFALHGMQITGIDINAEVLTMVDETVKRLGKVIDVAVTTKWTDATTEVFERASYDIVMLDHTLNHIPSKDSALTLLDKAYDAVKPGGHLWVRAIGKEDDAYHYLREAAQWGETEVIDDDVIRHPCTCSGALQFDPSLFFGQTDLLQFFAHRRATILHNQLIPQTGKRNIMFGEDFNRDMPVETSGMITIIAQKTAA